MSIWQDILQLGQKVFALTKKAEDNAERITKLEQNQLGLARLIKELQIELKLERQKNQQQKELYQSEINRYNFLASVPPPSIVTEWR